MRTKNKIDYWTPDKLCYDEVQKLKKFVQFVSSLEFASKEDKQKAEDIIFRIENIDKSETYKSWNVCLDIFDRDIQYGHERREGFYWRKWSVFYEQGFLEIVAETKHTADDLGHYGTDFCYYGGVFFNKDINGKRVYLDANLDTFINDVKDYKKYITETLNDIEIDIDI